MNCRKQNSPSNHYISESSLWMDICQPYQRDIKSNEVLSFNLSWMKYAWVITYSKQANIWVLTYQFSSVQFSSVIQLCLTLCDPMNHSMPGLPVHHQLPEFTQTHVHRVSVAIQPSHPLSSPSPLSPNPSQNQGLFQCVNFSHQVAKVLEFQPQHQSFQWTPGLISFRMDWLDFLAVQGTLKSLLQHHSSKASILQRSTFLTVQLSHP